MRRLSYLWPYLRPHRRHIAYGMGSILAAVLLGLLEPLLVGSAIDAMRRQVSNRVLLGYAGLLVGVALTQGLFNYIQRMTLVSISRDVELKIRNAYFESLERQPSSFFHDHQIESGSSEIEEWGPFFLRFSAEVLDPHFTGVVFNLFLPFGLPFEKLALADYK